MQEVQNGTASGVAEESPDKQLDKALRYLYSALRYERCTLMAIRFTDNNGRRWEVDTEDEAVTLRKRLEAEERAAWESGEVDLYAEPFTEFVWSPDVAKEFLDSAGKLPKRFLQVLMENAGSFVDSNKIIEALKLDSEVAFAGVLSGVSKQLKKLDVKPWQLYMLNVKWSGKTKLRSFRVTRDFEAAALELGWPEKWF